ncbi:MAG: hypothetical protein NWR72_12800 [Bacteroidia bacterium]|nr:hypothetical protein [Bacteroidia bacterium]
MQYKTPGVYLKDLTPPRSNVPELETAVPAFIGYTEKAQDATGQSLHLVPTRVRDFGEFVNFFGGAFSPESYQVFVSSGKDFSVESVDIQDRFYLYDCLQQYFDNQGKDCYIVSIGSFEDGRQPAALPPIEEDDCLPPALKQPTSVSASGGISERSRFQLGIDALARYDEPTLLLFPDAVRFKRASDGSDDPDALGQLQQYALAHCAKLQDRFALLDLIPTGWLTEEVAIFRDMIGAENLSYGAAYHPWLYSNYDHSFHFRELHFLDADTGTPLVAAEVLSSSGSSADAQKHRSLIDAANKANLESESLITLSGMSRSQTAKASTVIEDMIRAYQAEAQADATSATDSLDSYRQLAHAVRKLATAFVQLDEQVSSPIQTAIEDALSGFGLPNAIQRFISIEKSQQALIRFGNDPSDEATKEAAYALLNETRWLGNQVADDIAAAVLTSDSDLLLSLRPVALALAKGVERVYRAAGTTESQIENQLFTLHPVLSKVAEAIKLERKRLPPSAAIAALIVVTDERQGVWKAPANAALMATIGPETAIDDRMQEDMNVHESGKAINAIRSFPGRGAVVWGSRTLLSNSLEWRYVPVRRLFIYIEEFLKKATERFVFEPNDANTWLQVRNMIDAFLRALWRKGAFYGATAGDAYFIGIGLGESMIAQDILEGRLLIDIGLAAVRPAEFIIIRYECKMEEQI